MAPFLAIAKIKQAWLCSYGLTLAKVAIFSENETEIAQLMPYVCKINGCIDLVLGGKKR